MYSRWLYKVYSAGMCHENLPALYRALALYKNRPLYRGVYIVTNDFTRTISGTRTTYRATYCISKPVAPLIIWQWFPSNATRCLVRIRVGSWGLNLTLVGLLILPGICVNKNQRNQPLRAPNSVGRRNSVRVDEGRNSWSLVAIKMKARAGMGRGENNLLSDPRSE